MKEWVTYYALLNLFVGLTVKSLSNILNLYGIICE
jgi:hypothetical protein